MPATQSQDVIRETFDDGRWQTYRWRCTICPTLSFATFATEADAAHYLDLHHHNVHAADPDTAA
jgi:hypothetical protein